MIYSLVNRMEMFTKKMDKLNWGFALLKSYYAEDGPFEDFEEHQKYCATDPGIDAIPVRYAQIIEDGYPLSVINYVERILC